MEKLFYDWHFIIYQIFCPIFYAHSQAKNKLTKLSIIRDKNVYGKNDCKQVGEV